MIKIKIYEYVVEILGLTRIKSLYPCGFQQEWHMEFSFGGKGKRWGGGRGMYLNSVCVVWPDYLNSLTER